jgi:hypothetical protein
VSINPWQLQEGAPAGFDEEMAMADRPLHPNSPAPKVHHGQVKRAFSPDHDQAARPALLTEAKGCRLSLRYFDGATETVSVDDLERLGETLSRADLCQVLGETLLLVNKHYRVLGIATGPSSPPARLEVFVVSRIEGGSVVELVSGDQEQPSWQVFALRH